MNLEASPTETNTNALSANHGASDALAAQSAWSELPRAYKRNGTLDREALPGRAIRL